MKPSPTQRQDKEVFRKIFDDHWNRFKEVHPSYATPQYEDPVEKMLGCGKASRGYSEYLCTSCGRDLRRVCFSCKSSFCLSCAREYVEEFVRQVSQMLHAGVVYRHLILTIPEQLRKVFYRARHDRRFLSAFLRCGYACVEDVVRTVRRISVKIGAIVVIQTHGRSGQYNPHLHLILPDGGIHPEGKKWIALGYFPYEVLHKKWQYHLFRMLTSYVDTSEIRALVEGLWKRYPEGLVAHVTPGKVPASCRGLARYLAKYVACPPIAMRRLVGYEGSRVTYWYNDHQTQAKKVETVDALTFVGRMVQHILPKGFQRVRYYGIQATKTFRKWSEVIRNGVRRLGRRVRGVYEVVSHKTYRERYQQVSGQDPMICRYCGCEMTVWKIWHPKYGVIYDEYENIKAGKYEALPKPLERGGGSLWSSSKAIQLSLFPLRV